MIKCATCLKLLPYSAFQPKNLRRCKRCVANVWKEKYQIDQEYAERIRERARKRYQDPENRERQKVLARRKLLACYGLTVETYDELLRLQDGGCAICGVKHNLPQKYFDIDHNHSCCGRRKACDRCRRGLLCRNCNSAIGRLKEDPAIFQKASDYIIQHRERIYG